MQNLLGNALLCNLWRSTYEIFGSYMSSAKVVNVSRSYKGLMNSAYRIGPKIEPWTVPMSLLMLLFDNVITLAKFLFSNYTSK